MFRAFDGSCQALDDAGEAAHPGAQRRPERRELGPGADDFDADGVPRSPVLRVGPLSRAFSGSELDLSGRSGEPQHAAAAYPPPPRPLVLVLGAGSFTGAHVVAGLRCSGALDVRVRARDVATPGLLAALHSVAGRPAAAAPGAVAAPPELHVCEAQRLRDSVEGATFVVVVGNEAPAPGPPPRLGKESDAGAAAAAVRDVFLAAAAAPEAASGGAAAVRRVVYIGPAAAAAPSGDPQRELVGGSAALRACMEARRSAAATGVPTTFLLAAAPVGPSIAPGHISTAVAAVAAIADASPWFPFVPRVPWSLVDARDVALAVCAALHTPHIDGQLFLLANDVVYTHDVARVVASQFSVLRPPLWALPPAATLLIAAARGVASGTVTPGTLQALRHRLRAMRRPPEARKARRVLGLELTPISVTLRDTIAAALCVAPDPPAAAAVLEVRMRRAAWARRLGSIGIFVAGALVAAHVLARARGCLAVTAPV